MSATESSPGVHPTKKDSADITKGEAVVDLAVASTAEEGGESTCLPVFVNFSR
jgi:hypothetical protein